VLYGWGSNAVGQLASTETTIKKPKIISLPKFQSPSDYVVSLASGRRNSAVITRQGEVWVTGNYKKPVQKANNTIVEDGVKQKKKTSKTSKNIEAYDFVQEETF